MAGALKEQLGVSLNPSAELIETMDAASAAASSRGKREIGTGHLVLGVLIHDGEVMLPLLWNSRMTLDVLRRSIRFLLGEPIPNPSGSEPEFSGKVIAIAQAGEKMAQQYNHSMLDTGHLVAGMFRVRPDEIISTINSYGINLTYLRKHPEIATAVLRRPEEAHRELHTMKLINAALHGSETSYPMTLEQRVALEDSLRNGIKKRARQTIASS